MRAKSCNRLVSTSLAASCLCFCFLVALRRDQSWPSREMVVVWCYPVQLLLVVTLTIADRCDVTGMPMHEGYYHQFIYLYNSSDPASAGQPVLQSALTENFSGSPRFSV